MSIIVNLQWYSYREDPLKFLPRHQRLPFPTGENELLLHGTTPPLPLVPTHLRSSPWRGTGRYCCVVNCNNGHANTKGLTPPVEFYRFQNRWHQESRQAWLLKCTEQCKQILLHAIPVRGRSSRVQRKWVSARSIEHNQSSFLLHNCTDQSSYWVIHVRALTVPPLKHKLLQCV